MGETAVSLLSMSAKVYFRGNMRQIWIKKHGDPDVLQIQESPEPTPRIGEVRIRVETIGITYVDLLARMGNYRDAPAPPFVPGFEVAGVIDQIGQGVPNLREGDTVFAYTHLGGYSDVICVPYKQVFKRLKWMPPADAVALIVHYLTAYMMLVVMGSVRPEDKVLIHGVGGGVGGAALDICKIMGAETYGTASPEKHDFLLGRGLNHVIDYRNLDYEKVVMNLTGGKGVQVILDPLGGLHWPKNYRLLSPAGRLVHFGRSNEVKGKKHSMLASLRSLVMLPFYTPLQLMHDNKAVMGVNLGRVWARSDVARNWMKTIITWYDEALFRPQIDKTFLFNEVATSSTCVLFLCASLLHPTRELSRTPV